MAPVCSVVTVREFGNQAFGGRASGDSLLGGCQNYGPFLGTLNIRCRIIIIGTQKRTIILTTTHLSLRSSV